MKRIFGVLIFSLFFLFRCASSAPLHRISEAESRITQAQGVKAEVHAPAELELANQKLKEAHTHVLHYESKAARRKADEANALAELAIIKSRAALSQEELTAEEQKLAALTGTVADLKKRLGKPVKIVETIEKTTTIPPEAVLKQQGVSAKSKDLPPPQVTYEIRRKEKVFLNDKPVSSKESKETSKETSNVR